MRVCKQIDMKSILVVSALLLASAAAMFQSSGVVVKTEMANYAEPGSTVDLKVTVSKGRLSGFSKMQIIFPEGFDVEAVETRDGTFSFIERKMKIIWVSMPANDAFDVQFKVKTPAGASGSMPIEGQFSFIQEGKRTDEKFSTQIFVSKDKPSGMDSQPIAKADPEPAATPEPSAEPAKPVKPAAPAQEFSLDRALSTSTIKPNETVEVELTIKKKGISGFGKITEQIPAGFTATAGETNGAIFSEVGGEVRFLWMTLPAAENFTVSYKLKAGSAEGNKSIKGQFAYVENEKTRLTSTPNTSVMVRSEAIASAEPKPESKPEAEPVTTPEPEPASEPVASAATPKPEPKTESKPASQPESKPEPVSEPEPTTASAEPTTSGAVGEVSYRVQICATRKPVDTQYFVTNNSVNEKIYADMHEGWHKFTVGGFNVYKEARNHRETVKNQNNIVGPFVTAYNKGGTRITVQEALMISKQDWVP